MAVKVVGGSNPRSGEVMTTMGYRGRRAPQCMGCGERKDGLYTMNGNGQFVCPDCAGVKHLAVLRPAVGAEDGAGAG